MSLHVDFKRALLSDGWLVWCPRFRTWARVSESEVGGAKWCCGCDVDVSERFKAAA